MTDAPPPTIGSIELQDPRGQITEDFKRGACYVAKLANEEFDNDPDAVIVVTVPGGDFECKR